MPDKQPLAPESTAVRVALWRALHVQNDPPPHVLDDEIGLKLADPDVRHGLEMAEKGARASGTPFISFFTPPEIMMLAREAGFREVRHISAAALAQRYFANRKDGLRPPNNAEELLIAFK